MNRPTELRLTLCTLAGLAAAGAVAWRLGGAEATGVLAGYLAGAFLSAVGAAWQGHLLRTRPEKVMGAMVGTFLAKLTVLLAAALAFRLVEPAGRHVEWRSFLIAFAVGVLVVLAAGVADTLRTLRQEKRSVA